jgi:hypothetical protein
VQLGAGLVDLTQDVGAAYSRTSSTHA